MVDEKRLEDLKKKRFETGLSDDEADELGRLFAEQEDKPYSNAKLSKAPPGEQGADVQVGESSEESYHSAEEDRHAPPPGQAMEAPAKPSPGDE